MQFDEIGDDPTAYQDLSSFGAGAHYHSARVFGQMARFVILRGWSQSARELARAQREEGMRAASEGGPPATICAEIDRSDVAGVPPMSMRVMTGFASRAPISPLDWPAAVHEAALGIAREQRLSMLGSPEPIVVGGDTGYVWHQQGMLSGLAFGRPGGPMVGVHRSEMWALLPQGVLKVMLISPLGRAEEAGNAFQTLLSTWGWAAENDPAVPAWLAALRRALRRI